MLDVELEAAFVWTCSYCKHENFLRAVVGHLTSEAMERIASERGEQAATDFITREEDIENDVDEDTFEVTHSSAPKLLSRVTIAPRHVVCGGCKQIFHGQFDISDNDENDNGNDAREESDDKG